MNNYNKPIILYTVLQFIGYTIIILNKNNKKIIK